MKKINALELRQSLGKVLAALEKTGEPILLERGSVAAQGSPRDVIAQPVVERVYGWPVRIAPHPGPGRDAGVECLAGQPAQPGHLE